MLRNLVNIFFLISFISSALELFDLPRLNQNIEEKLLAGEKKNCCDVIKENSIDLLTVAATIIGLIVFPLDRNYYTERT